MGEKAVAGRLIRVLGSLRLTLFLIVTLTVIFSIGLVVPQKDLLSREMYVNWKADRPLLVEALEFLGFLDIYISPLVLVLWALFFLNLVVVMSRRVSLIWKRCTVFNIPKTAEQVLKSSNCRTVRESEAGAFSGMLKRKGYSVRTSGNGLHAVRNRWSPLATLMFHLSFLLLLAAGFLSFYTKFTAEASVAVGEVFRGEYENSRPARFGGRPDTRFMVDYVRPSYFDRNVPTDLDIGIITEKDERKTIGINRPYKDGLAYFVIKNIDVAPRIVLTDLEGNVLDDVFVKIKMLRGMKDFFSLEGYDFSAVFFTDVNLSQDDPVMSSGSGTPQALKQNPNTEVLPPAQPREIVAPALNLTAFRDGDILQTHTLLPGEYIEFNDRRAYFQGYVYWVKFMVSRDFGQVPAYAGFVLMTVALVFRFAFYRRDIRAYARDGIVHFTGRAEYFPILFAGEMERMSSGFEGTGEVNIERDINARDNSKKSQ
ncbi:MAG: cytochrome c biogenesis protein ResB [Thermodesulfovibrionales bacterium]|nr:cytochrome c biogenesis protein ResB [Thermodesulfovibrionales bacterium]